MAEERILFIRRDPALREAPRELSPRSVHFDHDKLIYAFYERKGTGRGVITYELQEAFVPYDRAVDLKPPTTMSHLRDLKFLQGLRN